MLKIVGVGPACAGLLTLYTIAKIESASFILVESLVNKTVLNIAKQCCCIKYFGRSVFEYQNKLLDMLLFSIFTLSSIWLTNGHPNVFGKSRRKQVFLLAFKKSHVYVAGLPSCFTCFDFKQFFNLTQVLNCYNTHITSTILYMANRCFKHIDGFICRGELSVNTLIMCKNLSTNSQLTVETSLKLSFFELIGVDNFPTVIGLIKTHVI